MTKQPKAIQAHGLSKSLGGRTVLREIDLDISAGEFVALTGENGSGKTTLLRCLAGIARPSAGEVHWFGQPTANQPNQRRLVGMVAHESRFYAHLTLRENLLFAARMCQVAAPVQRVGAWLDQTGLRAFADRQTRQVSRGMRQRLAIARALIHAPQILLLDEPFSGLDAAACDWLGSLLREQRERGCAICLATHVERLTRQLVDRTISLQNGSLADQQQRPAA